MNRRRYDMLVRVRAFYAERRGIFEGTPLAAGMLATLDASVTEVSQVFARQASGQSAAHEGTISRRQARAALRESLAAIRRTGQLLGLETAGFEGRFPSPHRGSDHQLVADAMAIAQNAAPLKDAFVAHGLAANVLADLPARIQAVEQAILRQATGRELHVAAREAQTGAIDAATAAVEALDKIFLNVPNLDRETQAMWKNARRIGPSRVKQTAAAEPGPTPPPATASAPAQESTAGSKVA